MEILILGGAGFLGNNLTRYCLKDKRNKITVLDSLEPRLESKITDLKEVLPKIKFIKGDIRNMSLLKRIIPRAEVIVNCAGQTSHPLSLLDPFFDVQINCLGNLSVLEAVRKYNHKALLIYTSSSTVIGKSLAYKIDEDYLRHPLDIYSANKGVAENYHWLYHQVYGLKTIVLRFANLYGPYGKASSQFGFINHFINLANLGREIKIFGSGKQKRNIMYVEDAVDLIYRSFFAKNLLGEIFFAVHREHYTIYKVAQTIVEVFQKGKIKKVPWPKIRKKIEIKDIIISGTKLYYRLGWKPKYCLKDGLLKTKAILEQKQK